VAATFSVDLSERGGAGELARAAGAVDVLVNCAGVGLYRPFERLEAGEAERLFAVNVLAPIELTRALLPGMLERGSGHVVNVGSVVGFVGRPREAVYAASKAALAVFGESLRAEVAHRGIGISLVAPVAVRTRFFEARGAPYGRSFPRQVGPERVAAAVVDAIEQDRPVVLVPRWLVLPVRLHGAAPGLFRALASRFDRVRDQGGGSRSA
jgi:short-subunit dehydrogenase